MGQKLHVNSTITPAPSTALRSVKLARTTADLEGAAEIKMHHLAEAIQYWPRR